MNPRFPGQNPNETLKILVRPHWLVLLRTIVAILFLAIIPVAALVVLAVNGVATFSGIGLAITAVTVPAYYLTLVTWFFIAWVDYYLDVGVVTDQRVIDFDQRGLFQRNVAELDCRKVQDINADKTGFLETIFDFGNVVVQTAGERPNFVFHAVPHPDQMVEQIRVAVSAVPGRDDGVTATVSGTGEAAAAAGAVAANEVKPPARASEAPSQPSTGPSQPAQSPAAPDRPAESARPEGAPDQDLPRQYER